MQIYVTSFLSSTMESPWGILWLLKSLSLSQVALGAMQLLVLLPVGLIASWHSHPWTRGAISWGWQKVLHKQLSWSCILSLLRCSPEVSALPPLEWSLWGPVAKVTFSHCCQADVKSLVPPTKRESGFFLSATQICRFVCSFQMQ